MIYAILIVEILILICRLIRSYKLMNNKKREYNIDYWIAPVMYGKWSYAYVFAHMLSTFSIVVLSLVIFYNTEIDYEFANIMIFLFIIVTFFIYIIEPTIIKAMEIEVPLAVDKMENTELPPKKEMSVIVKKITKIRFVIIGCLVVSMLLFFIFNEFVIVINDKNGYNNKSEEEALLMEDTTVFMDNQYIYSYSDKTSCLNVYDINGKFVNSWIIPHISNGASMAYEYNGIIYIQNRNYEVYAYSNNEYYGKMIDCYDEVEVYDSNDNLLYKYDVSDSQYVFFFECFDHEKVYANVELSNNVSKKMIISKDNQEDFHYTLNYFSKNIQQDNNKIMVYNDKIIINNDIVVTDKYNPFLNFIVSKKYPIILTCLFVLIILVTEILIRREIKKEENGIDK